MASLVLKNFELRVKAQDPEHPLIEVVGRRGGIMGFILTFLRLSTRTSLSVTAIRVRSQSASLFGNRLQIVPVARIGSVSGGVRKPIELLFFAMILLVAGIGIMISADGEEPAPAIFAIDLAVALFLCFRYYIGKRFAIEIHPDGGPAVRFHFRASVIEGVGVNVETAIQTINVIGDILVSGADVSTKTSEVSAN